LDKKISQKVVREIQRLKVLREKITTVNLPFVRKIANDFYHRRLGYKKNLEVEELIHEGIFGLWQAIEKFDLKRKTSFSTYAWYWISRAMVQAITEKADLIRIPFHIHEKKAKYHQMNARMNVNEIPREELCQKLNLSLALLEKIENPFSFLSLQDGIGSRGLHNRSLEETLPSPHFEPPSEIVYRKEIREKVLDLFEGLTPIEKEVIKKRFGLELNEEYGREYTLEEIGRIFGVTRERIRQIEKKAILKLSKKIKVLKIFKKTDL